MDKWSHLHSLAAAVIFVSVVVSLRLVMGLWLLSKFGAVTRLRKVLWSFVALVPLIGPLFYGAFFKLPRPNRPGEGAPPSMSGTDMWGGH